MSLSSSTVTQGVDKTRVLGYTANTPRETVEGSGLPLLSPFSPFISPEYGAYTPTGYTKNIFMLIPYQTISID